MTSAVHVDRSRRRGPMILRYAVPALLLHLLVSVASAVAIGPRSLDPIANATALATLALSSAGMSVIGLVATAAYLSKRIRPLSGGIAGILCGMTCGITFGLTLAGIEYSLILYLALLAPTLLAILLATLIDREKTGWQTY